MKLNLNVDALKEFLKISSLIGENTSYLVGGIVRDTLLNKKSLDIDIATTVSPDIIHSLFPDALYFKQYGTTSFKDEGFKITIASCRKERQYLDYRHPKDIEFISDIYEDYRRRDFTINALYVLTSLDILDPSKIGLDDIQNKIIRMIGDCSTRLKEDPLRMVRAYRFAYELGFKIDEEIVLFTKNNLELLKRLNPQKIKEELKKIPDNLSKNLINELSLNFIFDDQRKA